MNGRRLTDTELGALIDQAPVTALCYLLAEAVSAMDQTQRCTTSGAQTRPHPAAEERLLRATSLLP